MTALLSQLRKSSLLPSALIITLLLALYGNSLWQLLRQQGDSNWLSILGEPYVRHVLFFSFWQALLSAVLSVSLGLLAAHALFYQSFIGKRWLLKLFSLSMVLPVLVAIFGLLGIYGKVGWLAQFLNALAIDWRPNIYGLSGILIAHVFFNLPLAAKIFLHALQSIPNQQRQLAAQLGVIHWHFIRRVEWAYVRTSLPSVFALIFMLCFTSFTIVLTLGGGPKYTTLEVAIYQAVTFDFDLQRASIFALMQFIFCFSLFAFSSRLSRPTPTSANSGQLYQLPMPAPIRIFQSLMIALIVLFIALPLLNVLVSSLNWTAWHKSLGNPQLYKALGFSLIIALCAGLLCLLMAVGLLIGARQFYWLEKTQIAAQIVNTGMTILAVPTLVLAVGLFLLLQQFSITTPMLFAIVVICNALMAMPFALRILAQPMYNNMTYYERLCQSLGIRGWARLRHIEWHTIKQPLQSAFALASALSLGDFTAIALFGNQDFTSLPRLLYQQLGHYRSHEAAVTAFILLLFCAVIFILIERYQDHYDPTQKTLL
ncbi:MAG: thiamine/thiamine pyrophosphate ABC transporter permease ThiP [Gammaproteobacteria bacterium]|nr:MAG: thiamine/thiamine pyrophosphate ABC transporter permease ThiP [Gammaproteobacteria bacterium]